MTHKYGPSTIGTTPPPESRPIYVCTECKTEMYADAAGQPYYRRIAGEWQAGLWDDLCLGIGLSRQVGTMLDLRELVLAAFADACPGLQWKIWNICLDDRRELFWRLADNDESLVYGESRGDVADIGENTFVENARCVWRPPGEDFVAVLVQSDVDGQVVAFMAAKMEQPKPPGGTA